MASAGEMRTLKINKKRFHNNNKPVEFSHWNQKLTGKYMKSMNKLMTKVQNKSLLLWLVDFQSPFKASMGFGIHLIEGMQ